MNNSVVLIGPMGAGKTTLGKKLARQLGVPFADTDKIISAKHGSVQSIFQKHGEEHFRDLETLALEKALASAGIVATGGGLPLREANRKLLEGNLVIFLDTSQEHVIGKINLNKRPLLKDNPDRWTEIYNERKPLYEQISQRRIFTGGKSLKTLLAELEEAIKDVV
ncbi:MAG: shikimate kinase [Aquiluna sp.]